MSETRGAEALGAAVLDGLYVAEEREGLTLRLRAWEMLEPELVCGITTAEAGDFGVFGAPADELHRSFVDLAGGLGFAQVSVPLLVHGREVTEVAAPGASQRSVSLALSARVDGQVTTSRGLLLAVTAADCVPAYLWDTETGALALVHAGWRGAAAGVLEEALDCLPAGTASSAVRVHLGPSICGDCYEVDEPVLKAFGFEGARARIDLRGLLALQALEMGVTRESISVSTHCTNCGTEPLYSHRGSSGRAGRMAAFLGLKVPSDGG